MNELYGSCYWAEFVIFLVFQDTFYYITYREPEVWNCVLRGGYFLFLCWYYDTTLEK